MGTWRSPPFGGERYILYHGIESRVFSRTKADQKNTGDSRGKWLGELHGVRSCIGSQGLRVIQAEKRHLVGTGLSFD